MWDGLNLTVPRGAPCSLRSLGRINLTMPHNMLIVFPYLFVPIVRFAIE